MFSFLAWYLLISLLGWLTFPLAYRLFPKLADRGYTLSRALGLLLWGFIFGLLASLGIVQNDPGGLGLAFVLGVGLSFLVLGWGARGSKEGEVHFLLVPSLSSLRDWLRLNRRLLITTEILFLVAFVVWAFVRACNPETATAGGEKFMEVAFINAIMRSPTFPPHDPWLSGYAISYYYFGYVMTAMLAEVTGVLASVAHNLMSALIFALSAIGAYGILYNLLAAWRNHRGLSTAGHPSLGLPLLGPFFLLIVSNIEGFLEVLHQRGIFWPSRFWIWLDMSELSLPPTPPLEWIPHRFIWWWRASRVITDFDLAGNRWEIIDEFPFFSYLLGDLHPHVLAMPFGLLAMAVALNIFLGGWEGNVNLFGFRIPIHWTGLVSAAMVLGGLAFLNTWDILAFATLVLGAFMLARVRARGWSWARLEEFFALAIPLGILSVILYLPFYLGFSSQASGILPNLVSSTRGAHLWVMFGSLFVPIFAYLIYLRAHEKQRGYWLFGLSIAIGLSLFLWLFSWLLGLVASLRMPDFVANYLNSQGVSAPREFFVKAVLNRLPDSGGWLTLLILLAVVMALLSGVTRRGQPPGDRPLDLDVAQPSINGQRTLVFNTHSFILLLVLLGGLLTLAPEFVYLRDIFGNRMNTIFKFYYQAWLFWSLAAAFGAGVMLQSLRGAWSWIYRTGLVIVLVMAMAYPVLGLLTKTNDFQIPAFTQALAAARNAGDPNPLKTASHVWTLDGAAYIDRENPGDALAIRWLRSAPYGVIVEATEAYVSYQYYARISTFSGLPAVIGWPPHEDQWRGSYAPQGSRVDDIKTLYETRDWNAAKAILDRYNIRYIYIGPLERSTYQISETKFQQNLTAVYQMEDVVIYEIP